MSNASKTITFKNSKGETKTRHAPVSADDFVAAAVVSKTQDEIVEKTGLTKASVQARLAKYRKMGIQVPTFAGSRGAPRLDKDKMNSLIAKLKGNSGQEQQTLTKDDVGTVEAAGLV